MNGCNWMNKSFSVHQERDKVVSYCFDCTKPLSGYIRKFNGKELCQECFNKQPRVNSRLGAGLDVIIKEGKTLDMKRKGESYFDQSCPEHFKITNEIRDRRRQDKPVDGHCFKEAGMRLKDLNKKGAL